MAKRLTDSRKWRDPWFRKLSPEFKLFWLYLMDECNHAGFWKVDLELASFSIGLPLDEQKLKACLGDRVHEHDHETWFVPKYISFQYGELNPSVNCHKSVLEELKKERVSEGLVKGCQTLYINNKDKDKNKDKNKRVKTSEIPPELLLVKAHFSQNGFGAAEAEKFWHHHNARGWKLRGGQLMKDWRSACVTWFRNTKEFAGSTSEEEELAKKLGVRV